MTYVDVFNGDADGIFALHQLRLAEPRAGARLVTGVKRDIDLLAQVAAQIAGGERPSAVTVLDVSLDRNRAHLLPLLEVCPVLYIDHHFPGEIPEHPNLTAHIDPSAEVCTSLIVDRLLGGRYRAWAVAAAFGDNLHQPARRAAADLGLSEAETDTLRELGELFNYNGYGPSLADLHFHPAELYRALQGFRDPFDFCRRSGILTTLRQGFGDDMARARALPPLSASPAGRIFRFPGEAWTRRVAGVFSNEKAREEPELAHALLVPTQDGSAFVVSIRAPLARPRGADQLCRAFPTGGGRAGAGGINALPVALMDKFEQSFQEVFTP